jgi:inorganic pyrophosphatase
MLDVASKTCRAIIETPRGKRSKYDYDPDSGLFKLYRVLPEGMTFPLDFGFIPSTMAEDGDPLDVLVLTDEPSPVGALVEARIIGVIEADQEGRQGRDRNDRVIAVAQASRRYQAIKAVDDLGKDYVDELKRFWVTKGEFEGKGFRVLGVKGANEAVERVRRASQTARGA